MNFWNVTPLPNPIINRLHPSYSHIKSFSLRPQSVHIQYWQTGKNSQLEIVEVRSRRNKIYSYFSLFLAMSTFSKTVDLYSSLSCFMKLVIYETTKKKVKLKLKGSQSYAQKPIVNRWSKKFNMPLTILNLSRYWHVNYNLFPS